MFGWINLMNREIGNKIEIYSRDESPFGKSWQEWTAEWWRWFLSIPRDQHPSYDNGHTIMVDNIHDPNVLFLAGTTGGKIRDRVALPPKRAVLLPVINFTTSYSEQPDLLSEAEMIKHAESNIDDIVKKEAIIDGTTLFISEKNRVRTAPFDFAFPKNNIYGIKEGPSRGVGDGYWIFLKPMRPGSHSIKTYGSCLSGRIRIEVDVELIIKS
jgi:hypothetical protein